MLETSPSGWFPDPFGRHERRYWDGHEWTHHVASRGSQGIDAPGHQQLLQSIPRRLPPAAWYPDPLGRYETRYWDGGQWTQHVVAHGVPGLDPIAEGAMELNEHLDAGGGVGLPSAASVAGESSLSPTRATKKIQRQVGAVSIPVPVQTGDEAIFSEPVLVVNQKAKLFGVNSEYRVFDQHGTQIGAVQEIGQNLLKKAVGASGPTGRQRFQVVDPTGRVLIALDSPATFIKSRMTLSGANGIQGEIVQKTVGFFGKIRFSLESGGQQYGSINAEDWNAWDFNIQDATGTEVARITKTWAGWAKERFTKADNYVVQIHRPLEEPLRSLAIAAALAIDTALKEGTPTRKRGLGSRRHYS